MEFVDIPCDIYTTWIYRGTAIYQRAKGMPNMFAITRFPYTVWRFSFIYLTITGVKNTVKTYA